MPNHVSIPILRVVNCAMRPPDKYFPHSFFSSFYPAKRHSLFHWCVCRVLSHSLAPKNTRGEREGKNIACFSVIKGPLRDSWHDGSLSHLSHNRVKCWCVRWVRRRRRRAVLNLGESQRGCNSPPLLANAWMAAWRALSGNSGSLHYGAHELLLRLFSSPAIKCQDYVAGLLRINYTPAPHVIRFTMMYINERERCKMHIPTATGIRSFDK